MFDLEQIIKEEKRALLHRQDAILSISPKSLEEQKKDKYENYSGNIDNYTWMAYAKNENSLYSFINQKVIAYLKDENQHLILDVGCGVGKTIYDLGENFKNDQFVGFDYSQNMLERAHNILIDGGKLKIDLSSSGLGSYELACKALNNVHLVQGDVSDMPFVKDCYDVVLNTFLIDRVDEIELAFEQMLAVLKPGGLFIMASPLNFQKEAHWKYANVEILIALLQQLGLYEIEWQDNYQHQEILDARGNSKMWKSLILWGKKGE